MPGKERRRKQEAVKGNGPLSGWIKKSTDGQQVRAAPQQQHRAPSENNPTASNQTSTENPAASSANQNLADQLKIEPDDEKTTLDQKHQSHSFYYQINKDNHMVTCTKRCTVLEALQADPPFKTFLERNKGKSIIIERDDSFIATHFPCRLLERGETVIIKCFSGEAAEVPDGDEIKDGDIVTFCISSIGGLNMRQMRFLRNSNLKNNKPLCIYAYIGETVEDALKRDGRFADEVFQGSISLYKGGEQRTNIQLTTKISAEFARLKILQLKKTALKRLAGDKTPTDKRKPKSSRKSDPSSNADNPSTSSASGGSKPSSDNTKPDKKTDSRKKEHGIPDSTEILKILREQFQGLVELMKERHKKTKVEDVVELIREEFGKNIQSFSEIRHVKKLMDMSASVCYIEVEEHMKATGFLLFDRYILTNAHVIKDITVNSVLQRKVRVTFAFEGRTKKPKKFWRVKEEVVAARYVVDKLEHSMDFALLELDDLPGKPDLPLALLREYAHLPKKGGICLIGHPDAGVKKMDLSAIIEDKERANAVDIHFSERGRHIEYINQLKDKELTYNTYFFDGSSGSPIFGEKCQLVGLHTGGFSYKTAGKKNSVIEFGNSMRSILEHLLLQMMEEKKCEPLSKLIAETMKSKFAIQVVAEFIRYMLQGWKEDLDSVLLTVITTAKDCDGSTDGSSDASSDGSSDGSTDGSSDGSSDVSSTGSFDGGSELHTLLREIIPTEDLQTLMINNGSSKSLHELSEFLKEKEKPMDVDQQTAGNQTTP
ncbi:serine protease FAM111A-like [Brienomyrus brachyistius]|uniref:serine protease FAM111A-like n=1 Tax=Brienomyrus brachyistius TaxID=42636 RepID=UPI0020B3146D|nr:serine protease FAM111A-like [Brienomyrus brachyistius]